MSRWISSESCRVSYKSVSYGFLLNLYSLKYTYVSIWIVKLAMSTWVICIKLVGKRLNAKQDVCSNETELRAQKVGRFHPKVNTSGRAYHSTKIILNPDPCNSEYETWNDNCCELQLLNWMRQLSSRSKWLRKSLESIVRIPFKAYHHLLQITVECLFTCILELVEILMINACLSGCDAVSSWTLYCTSVWQSCCVKH